MITYKDLCDKAEDGDILSIKKYLDLYDKVEVSDGYKIKKPLTVLIRIIKKLIKNIEVNI